MDLLKKLAMAMAACCVAAKHDSSPNPPPIVDGSECECFVTNGTSPSYFSHHLFFDFRNLPSYAGLPPLVTNSSLAAIAPVTSDYFATPEWNDTWQIQGWSNLSPNGELTGNSTVLMVHSQSNVFIQGGAQTYLSLRTARLPTFQTAAAFQSRSNEFQYVSARMLARTVGSPGAVSGMFTYHETPVQEADLEILTRGPRESLQYTNQPGSNPDGSRNPKVSRNTTLPDGLIWSDWAVHRLDWSPQRTAWFVNGLQTAEIAAQVPRGPSSVNFNAWSDGGSWSGNMSVYDEASLDIQWIEMVYNSTASHQKRGVGPHGPLARRGGRLTCKVVCSIDNSPVLGKAALVWNSTAAHASADLGGSRALLLSLALGSLLWHLIL